jgi:hypothetical protein
MTISFRCPQCQKRLSVADDKAGRPGRCPSCAATVQIPTSQTAVREPVTEPPKSAPSPQAKSSAEAKPSLEPPATPAQNPEAVNWRRALQGLLLEHGSQMIAVVVGLVGLLLTLLRLVGAASLLGSVLAFLDELVFARTYYGDQPEELGLKYWNFFQGLWILASSLAAVISLGMALVGRGFFAFVPPYTGARGRARVAAFGGVVFLISVLVILLLSGIVFAWNRVIGSGEFIGEAASVLLVPLIIAGPLGLAVGSIVLVWAVGRFGRQANDSDVITWVRWYWLSWAAILAPLLILTLVNVMIGLWDWVTGSPSGFTWQEAPALVWVMYGLTAIAALAAAAQQVVRLLVLQAAVNLVERQVQAVAVVADLRKLPTAWARTRTAKSGPPPGSAQ